MEQIVLNKLLANIGYNLIIKYRLLWLVITSTLIIFLSAGLKKNLDELTLNHVTESNSSSFKTEQSRERSTDRLSVNIHLESDPTFSDTGLFKIQALQKGEIESAFLAVKNSFPLFVIAVTIAFTLIFIFFQKTSVIAAILLIMVSSTLGLYGSLGWLEIPLSSGNLSALPLILFLSVSYPIHFINHFNFFFQRKGEKFRPQALHYAFGQTLIPGISAAVITTISFSSLLFSYKTVLWQIGISCSVGTVITFSLSMILVPIFCSFGPIVKRDQSSDIRLKPVFPRGMVSLSRIVLKKQTPALLLIIQISALILLFTTNDSLKIRLDSCEPLFRNDQQCMDQGISERKETSVFGFLVTTGGSSSSLQSKPQFFKPFVLVIATFLIGITIALRSLRAGLISLFPLFLIAGYLALLTFVLEIPTDRVTFIILPIILGISIDTTVHFLIHFRSELFGFREYPKANQQTFMKMGHAVILIAVALISGFGVLGFTSDSGIKTIGILTSIGMIVCYGSIFCILPTGLVKLKPFGKTGFTTQS